MYFSENKTQNTTLQNMISDPISLINLFVAFFFYAISIGVSYAVEYYIDPSVHREHNPLYIKGLFHAFFDGLDCCWFVVIALSIFLLLEIPVTYLPLMMIINICVPIWNYYTGNYGHDLLYMIIFAHFTIMTFYGIARKFNIINY